MALTFGTRLGPYEIQSSLGAGGMGEVYRARDTRLDRTVAVKILPSHLSENDAAKQRFDREARGQ
jgi:serine/threonine protein kinase